MMKSGACGGRTLGLIVSPKSPLCVMDTIEKTQKMSRRLECWDCTTGTGAVGVFPFIFTPSEGESGY